MELAALQARIVELTSGIEHPRVGAALALAEECGEVMRCVLDREYYGKDVQADLTEEVGDVLIALCEFADRFRIDLAGAARDAVDKLEAKAPKWRDELGDHLQTLRRRMDGDDADA